MTVNSSLIPLGHPIADNSLFVNQQWAFWFQQFAQALPPQGTGYVIDGTADTYGPCTIYQGLAVNRGSNPATGSIYIAVDTGQIFVAVGNQWELQLPAFTGDVTSDQNTSVLSLANVNNSVGTYGGSSTIPEITVDSKGRITNVINVPLTLPPIPAAGPFNSVQFNNNGSTSGTSQFTYTANNNTLHVVNQTVSGDIAFTNPTTTFNNLSPLQTKGDLLSSNGVINTVLPVGTNGQVLVADSTESSGLKWTTFTPGAGGGSVPYFVPFGTTYVLPDNYQANFILPIDSEGDIEIDGYLIELANQ